MFAAPPNVETRVFAALPPELDLAGKGVASAWLADRPYHAAALGSFLEGPVFAPDGTLYCVDIAYGRILSVDRQGRFAVVKRYDGAPNGLALHRDGRLFIADHKRGLLALDPRDGRMETILGGAFGEGFKGLNDLAFANDGDLYFTDQGQTGLQDASGRLFRLRADGRLDIVLAGIPSPNGLAINRAQDVLFLAVTRANAIWRVPLPRHGATTKVGVFIHLSGGGGPDGLALDAEDSLFVAQPMLGCVWGFDRYGEPIHRIRSCTAGRMTTNLAFGHPDAQRLYITESSKGTILVADLPVTGQQLPALR